MTLVYAKKKSTHPRKESTKSTPAKQKKPSHRKKAQKSTLVLLKALTMIPGNSKTFAAIAVPGLVFGFQVENCINTIIYCLIYCFLLWMVSLGLNQSPDMAKYMFH